MRVRADGSVMVTKPIEVSVTAAEEFARRKADWILRKLEFFAAKRSAIPTPSHFDFLEQKSRALALAQARIKVINAVYKFKFKEIKIKNMKTRWGSCSKKGNLNFSYRIIYLPGRLVDYIMAHELCHLREFNHSEKFWRLVGRVIPDYKQRKKELRLKYI